MVGDDENRPQVFGQLVPKRQVAGVVQESGPDVILGELDLITNGLTRLQDPKRPLLVAPGTMV